MHCMRLTPAFESLLMAKATKCAKEESLLTVTAAKSIRKGLGMTPTAVQQSDQPISHQILV